ncbi:hypothetical protein E2C01_040002 [Portunus trituberculatus]|uniref:Uncharacterized protein n=1 Tax=Portunus trituberculatus TaxID=210409 RepID=A0A5B7FLA4_PORTR|nr:hypothetical protein [Portunus trituberculatus]
MQRGLTKCNWIKAEAYNTPILSHHCLPLPITPHHHLSSHPTSSSLPDLLLPFSLTLTLIGISTLTHTSPYPLVSVPLPPSPNSPAHPYMFPQPKLICLQELEGKI